MAKPRISREEYLRRRGDRTRRLAPNLEYQVVPTAIVASKGIEQSTIGQVVILIAANLLGRWLDCGNSLQYDDLRSFWCPRLLHGRT